MAEWKGRILLSPELMRWQSTLGERERKVVGHLIEVLMSEGPGLGHPKGGLIKGEWIAGRNLLELRGQNPSIRILYIFDRDGTALLLHGGDKSIGAEWTKWYKPAVRQATTIYERHYAAQHERTGAPR